MIRCKGPVLQEPESDAVVKMRGLPFEAGPAEIVRFFEGRRFRNFPSNTVLRTV